MKIVHYDLFAGIGGFSLALDTIFNEYERKHIFCEWEPFPTAVLRKHWPNATYYGDIADLVADTERQRPLLRQAHQAEGYTELGHRDGCDQTQDITILTGGFPCQPFSHAGRRAGTADNRYLWPSMLEVIRNVRPDWVIAENVRGLVTWNEGMVLETVCADLESEGYEVQPLIIPAVAVGAPHRRDRVWIVAHTINSGQRREERRSITTSDSLSEEHRTKDSTTREFERATSYGEIVRLVTNPRRERWSERTSESLRPTWQESEQSNNSNSCFGWDEDWREVAFATCYDGVDDGLSRQMDGATISASRHRKERLKACGNAIVPQVAMEIFKAIRGVMVQK